MIKTTGREAVVQLHGRLDRTQAGRLWREVTDTLKATTPQHLVLDFRGVTGIDTAGVALLLNLEDRCGQQGIELSHLHLPAAVGQFLGSWREHSSGRPVHEVKPRIDPLSRLGKRVWQNLCEAYAFIQFLGDFLAAGPRQLMHPGGMHMREILYQIQFVGVDAVPLLVTMSLLLGALMVFQGIDTILYFRARYIYRRHSGHCGHSGDGTASDRAGPGGTLGGRLCCGNRRHETERRD